MSDGANKHPAAQLSPSALQACLMHVSQMLGRPISPALLLANQRGQGKPFDIREAISAAERAGLQAALGKVALSDLSTRLLPAILILSNGHTIVLERREENGDCVVFDSLLGNESGLSGEAQVTADYSGYVLLLRPQHTKIETEASLSGGHWFWSNLLKHRWSYAQVVLAALMINLLALSSSLFIMIVYDRVLPNEAVESLFALTIGVSIALLFDFAIKTLRSSFLDRSGQAADKLIGRAIFEQLLDIKLKARKGSTGVFANTLREFESLREFLTSATLVTLVDLPFLLIFVFVIYLIGGPLAIVPALAIPIVLIIGFSIQPFLRRLSERLFKEGQQKQSVLVETVAGLEAVKSVGAGRQMRDRWEDAVVRQADFGVRSRAISQFALNSTMLVQQLSQIMIVLFGVFLIMNGTITMGALIASVILTGRALAPLGQVAQTLTRLHGARTSYTAINELMQAEREHPDDKPWLSRPKLAGGIKFEKVSFSYPNRELAALREVSFNIKPGEKVAIIGRIGCGKSTIAKLLLGLYEPDEGAILVDETEIRQINPDDLRRNIGAVLQDVWLFSGSVRENIAVGAIRPSDADILRAAQLSGVDDFIAGQQSGYDLILGERGEGLSGGQKQSITLARALVGRPSILLFDEPTSAMDAQSEAQFIHRMKTAIRDETVLIITHRTSLLSLVDRVIVLDNGQVAGDGPKSILNVEGVPLRTGAK